MLSLSNIRSTQHPDQVELSNLVSSWLIRTPHIKSTSSSSQLTVPRRLFGQKFGYNRHELLNVPSLLLAAEFKSISFKIEDLSFVPTPGSDPDDESEGSGWVAYKGWTAIIMAAKKYGGYVGTLESDGKKVDLPATDQGALRGRYMLFIIILQIKQSGKT